MTLTRQAIIAAAALAVPVALALTAGAEWLRGRDARLALERIVDALNTDAIKDACEADPNWFLAGPRSGRPTAAERLAPDADIQLPRPNPDPLPIDIYAYNEQFSPTSSAGARFPNDVRNAMRASPPTPRVISSYDSPAGTGLQIAQLTGWSPGPCAVLVVRMQPRPGLWSGRILTFLAIGAITFGVALAALMPTVGRIRRLSADTSASASSGAFQTVAPDERKDELSALAFSFNDAATEIHRRGAENADRAEALRRTVSAIATDVVAPLATLRSTLSRLADASPDSAGALAQAHDLTLVASNLMAAAELRLKNDPLPVTIGDVAALVREAAGRHRALARQTGVTLEVSVPDGPLPASLNESMAPLALDNVLDNAIRYNRSGGRVDVVLEPRSTGDVFSLRIVNPGAEVSDDLLKGLTAIRRFRGDERWNRRPNAPGLGLAVAREIADRSGWQLDIRRSAGAGFEVEFTGGRTPKRT